MALSKKDKLKMCFGCRNDFYNGHNDIGVTQCWSLKNAKVVKRKRVHLDQVPPWTQKAIRVLSCYHESRYVFVGEHQTC